MDPLTDGCRLCLDLFMERFTTIENPQLKDQMDKVFCFTIEPKLGYSSGVCQSCSFAISEFYQFSEKVRQNQEVLNGNVTNSNPTVDSKISHDNVYGETFSKSGVQETAEDACELMDELSAEEVPILDSKMTVEDIKFEPFSDSEIPETTKNASEPKDMVSAEEEMPSSGDDESYEPSSKKSQTKRERYKEDQLFNKHFNMICSLCGTSAKTFTALNYHFRKEHKRRGYVVCCNKKLLKRCVIRNHIDFHANNPNSFRCEVCGTKHSSADNLNAHIIRMHSSDDQDSFDHSSKTSVQKSTLVQYAQTMFPKTTGDACELQATISASGVEEDPTSDSEFTIVNVKVETLNDFGLPETTESAFESKDKVSDAESLTLDSEISIENTKVETIGDCGPPEMTEGACEPEDEVSREGVPTLDSEITIEDVKIETYSDSKLVEPTEDACEPSPKKSQTERKGRIGKTGKPTKKFFQTKQERYEEDQIFNSHFRMICDLCGTSVATFTELISHFWKEHNTRYGYIMCCNKKLFNRNQVREHIDFHTDPDVFRCQVCGINAKNKDILIKHMLLKHSSAGPLNCDHCSQSFAEKRALTMHMKRHAKFNCPKCNKLFARSDYLLSRHITDCAQIVCDICGKEFTSKRNFDQHMKKHAGIELPFKCQKCNRRLKSKQSLRKHMNLVHIEGNRKFQCDICLRNYPHASSLNQHKAYAHPETKHECEFCGKMLKSKRSLKGHRATHHADKMKR